MMDDRGWMDDALCLETDPDAFFPDDGVNATAAYKVCADCPVRLLCLEYAITHDISDGVWGGASPRKRLQLTRRNVMRTRASLPPRT